MANEYGLFWNSQGGDRTYNADSMEEWLKPFFTTGVFNGHLQVTATGGMGISVGEGYANINGKVRYFAEPTSFTLETVGSTDRCDIVVVERHDGNREITLKVITGTSATPPEPIRESGIYQLVLAQILITKGSTEITQADITDTRTNSELCGYVVEAVDNPDFTTIYAQFVAQFNEWFEGIKGQLSTDAAGHLQNEINSVAENEFNYYYDLVNRNTQYTRDDTGEIIGWTSENDGLTATTSITYNDTIKTFTTVIEDGTNRWTKVSAFDSSTDKLTETYTKEAIS